MFEEIERQVAARVNSNRQDPPLSQNRNPDYELPSEQMELSNWEQSQEPGGTALIGQLRDLTQRMRGGNDELANLIGNASDME